MISSQEIKSLLSKIEDNELQLNNDFLPQFKKILNVALKAFQFNQELNKLNKTNRELTLKNDDLKGEIEIYEEIKKRSN